MENNLETKEAFSFQTLVKLIRFRKKFVLIFIITSMFLTTVYSFIIPHSYTASASILPPEDDASGGGLSSFLQSISGGISLGGLSKGLKVELYLEMLTSRFVAEYIVKKCELKKYEEFQYENDDILFDMVKNILEVEANRSGLMIVNATIATSYFPNSKDKKDAAVLASQIANAAVEGLNNLNRQKSNSKAKKKKEFITNILNENLKKIDSIDADLEKFQKENKLIAIDEQTSAILENIVGVGVELSKAEVELGIAQQQYESSSPIVKAYQRKVDDLKKQYEKTQIGGLIPTDRFSIPLDNVPKLIRKYTTLARDQKILTQVIMYLETQKHQEEIQEASDIPMFQVLDEAFPPYKKASPSKLIMLVLAFILSSLIACSWITYRAFQIGKFYIQSEENKN